MLPAYILIFYFWIGFSVLMVAAWVVLRRIDFWSGVDAIWAFGLGLAGIVLFLIFFPPQTLSILAFFLFLVWSFRLGFYLSIRLRRHFSTEDRRYQKLRDNWKEGAGWKSFIFFQFQALIQTVLIYPFIVIALDRSAGAQALDLLGIVMVVVGLIGESISDWQLSNFKKNRKSSLQICKDGLWRYSRHPNYFFEWFIWAGFALIAFHRPDGFASILAPLLMYILLMYVTGVRPSEAESIQSKGDAYRQYQQETSKLFPWFSKIAKDSCAN